MRDRLIWWSCEEGDWAVARGWAASGRAEFSTCAASSAKGEILEGRHQIKSPPATQGKREKQKPLYSLSGYPPVLFESQTSPSSSTLHLFFSGLILFQGIKNVGALSQEKEKKKVRHLQVWNTISFILCKFQWEYQNSRLELRTLRCEAGEGGGLIISMVLPVQQFLFPVGGGLCQKRQVILNATICKTFALSRSLVSKRLYVLTVQTFSLLIVLKLGNQNDQSEGNKSKFIGAINR